MITIRCMLEAGRDCGLTYLEEAYYNVMRHHDVFFIAAKNEAREFDDMMRDSPFVVNNKFEDLTIDESLKMLNKESL